MTVVRLAIPEVVLLTPPRFADARGHFSETFNAERFRREVADVSFLQDNQSLSRARGTLRGLHLQLPPFAQGKLVRVVRGAVFDVAVDVRAGSPHYGRHVGATLSAENGAQLWIPPGFLHGFCTIEPDTEVLYKVTAAYDRGSERGIVWNDPTLAIPWPVAPEDAVLSDKDAALPRWSEGLAWFPA
ncbi:MAG: dTDP-4-dehydrorhamnose 3,5-epimerase [Acetobacteraceae bacterium]